MEFGTFGRYLMMMVRLRKLACFLATDLTGVKESSERECGYSNGTANDAVIACALHLSLPVGGLGRAWRVNSITTKYAGPRWPGVVSMSSSPASGIIAPISFVGNRNWVCPFRHSKTARGHRGRPLMTCLNDSSQALPCPAQRQGNRN